MKKDLLKRIKYHLASAKLIMEDMNVTKQATKKDTTALEEFFKGKSVRLKSQFITTSADGTAMNLLRGTEGIISSMPKTKKVYLEVEFNGFSKPVQFTEQQAKEMLITSLTKGQK